MREASAGTLEAIFFFIHSYIPISYLERKAISLNFKVIPRWSFPEIQTDSRQTSLRLTYLRQAGRFRLSPRVPIATEKL